MCSLVATIFTLTKPSPSQLRDVCSLVAAIVTLTKPSAISTQENLAGNLHIPTLQRREESYTLSCTGVGLGGGLLFFF